MFTIEEANIFLKKLEKIPFEVRPKFHFTPIRGWINDPYGLVYFNNLYHLFYQYHPFNPTNGDMARGHLTTKDFIHFKEEEIALAPDKDYDNSGCWSGSALVKDGLIYLFYTGFSKHDDGKFYQTINLAYSNDGYNFKKYEKNPIIDTKDIPACASIYDFRDPCVFIKEDKVYLIIGGKNEENKEAMLLLYVSEDFKEFKFKKVLFKDTRFGTMFECPNLLTFDDSSFIIMSPQNLMPKNDCFFNVSSSVYTKLPKDIVNENLSLEKIKEIDHGFEFYAPTVNDELKISVSWLQMWGRRYYLNEIKYSYINSLSLFKDIKKEGDILKFIPLKTYDKYFNLKNIFDAKIFTNQKISFNFGNCFRAKVKAELVEHNIFTLSLMKNEEESVRLIVSKLENRIYIDRTSLKVSLDGVDHTVSTLGLRFLDIDLTKEEITFDIFVDEYIIEIFLNDYKDSISLLSFSKGKSFEICTNLEMKVEIQESEYKE